MCLAQSPERNQMEPLPWIAEVRRRENSDYPYMAYAVHRKTGARVHDDNYSDLSAAKHYARQKAAQVSRTSQEEIGFAASSEPIAAFSLFDSNEGIGYDYEEIPIGSIGAITVENLAAAGFTCCGSPVWYRKHQLLIRLGQFSITAHVSQGEGDCEIGKVRNMADILILDRIVSGNTPDNKDQ